MCYLCFWSPGCVTTCLVVLFLPSHLISGEAKLIYLKKRELEKLFHRLDVKTKENRLDDIKSALLSSPAKAPVGQDYISHNPSRRPWPLPHSLASFSPDPGLYWGVVADCSRDFCFLLLCCSCRETSASSATPSAAALARDPDPASPPPELRSRLRRGPGPPNPPRRRHGGP